MLILKEMELDTILTQLESFSSSLVQLQDTLSSLVVAANGLDSSTANRDEIMQHISSRDALNGSKTELIGAIILMNKCLQECNYNGLGIGSLLLAPRFLSNKISYDYCILTNILNRNGPEGEVDNEDRSYEVCWLRPRSIYELYSAHVTFSFSQLQLPSAALPRLIEEENQLLHHLQEGDYILYQHLTPSMNYGLWGKGQIVRMFTEDEKFQIKSLWNTSTNTNHSHSSSSSSSGSSMYCVIDLDINLVAPYPTGELLSSGLSSRSAIATSSSSSNNASKSAGVPHKEGADNINGGDNYDSDGFDSYGMKSLPSYAAQHTAAAATVPSYATNYDDDIFTIMNSSSSSNNNSSSNNASSYSFSSSSSSFASSSLLLEYNLGSWERYTKGIGSKLLQKMGYVRHSGRGLGKHAQGICKPIQGLMKALPAGLSLDYLHTAGASQADDREEAAMRRKSKKKIVQDFNQPKKREKEENEQQHRSTFDFINKVETNPPLVIHRSHCSSNSISSSHQLPAAAAAAASSNSSNSKKWIPNKPIAEKKVF